jgi:site-specific DNA-methyltransferase (adenine-specific)
MANDEWQTPKELFDALNKEFYFDVDLCANEENKKCEGWIEDVAYFVDKLKKLPADERPYYKNLFMNPPYSRGNINKCMKAARELSEMGYKVVTLTRFDPSAKWYQDEVHNKAREVRMLKKRVRFIGADGSYPFPCCVTIFQSGRHQTHYRLWDWV